MDLSGWENGEFDKRRLNREEAIRKADRFPLTPDTIQGVINWTQAFSQRVTDNKVRTEELITDNTEIQALTLFRYIERLSDIYLAKAFQLLSVMSMAVYAYELDTMPKRVHLMPLETAPRNSDMLPHLPIEKNQLTSLFNKLLPKVLALESTPQRSVLIDSWEGALYSCIAIDNIVTALPEQRPTLTQIFEVANPDMAKKITGAVISRAERALNGKQIVNYVELMQKLENMEYVLDDCKGGKEMAEAISKVISRIEQEAPAISIEFEPELKISGNHTREKSK